MCLLNTCANDLPKSASIRLFFEEDCYTRSVIIRETWCNCNTQTFCVELKTNVANVEGRPGHVVTE